MGKLLSSILALGATAAVSAPLFFKESSHTEGDLEDVVATYFANEYSIQDPGKYKSARSGLVRTLDNSHSIDILDNPDPLPNNLGHIIEVRANQEGPGSVTLSYSLKDTPHPETDGTFSPDQNTRTYILTDQGISLVGTLQAIEIVSNKYNPDGQNPSRYVAGIDPESEEAFQNLAKINRLVDFISGEKGEGNELEQLYSTVIGEIEERTGVPVEKISNATRWIVEEKTRQDLRQVQRENPGKRVIPVRDYTLEGIELKNTVIGRSTTFFLSDENGNPPTGIVELHANISYTGTESNRGFRTMPFTSRIRINFGQEEPQQKKEKKKDLEGKVDPESIFGEWEIIYPNDKGTIKIEKEVFDFDGKLSRLENIQTHGNGLIEITCLSKGVVKRGRKRRKIDIKSKFSFIQPSPNILYLSNTPKERARLKGMMAFLERENGAIPESYRFLLLRKGIAPKKTSIKKIAGMWERIDTEFSHYKRRGYSNQDSMGRAIKISDIGILILSDEKSLYYDFTEEPTRVDRTFILPEATNPPQRRGFEKVQKDSHIAYATLTQDDTLIFEIPEGIFTYTRAD